MTVDREPTANLKARVENASQILCWRSSHFAENATYENVAASSPHHLCTEERTFCSEKVKPTFCRCTRSNFCFLTKQPLCLSATMVQPKSIASRDSAVSSWLPQCVGPSSSKSTNKYHKNFKLYKSLKINYYRHATSYKKMVVVAFVALITACMVSGLLASSRLSDHFDLLINTSPPTYPWKAMSRPLPKKPSKYSRYNSRAKKDNQQTSDNKVKSKGTNPEAKTHYDIPETMTTVGDKTDFYAALRLAYDSLHPSNPKRAERAVEEQRLYSFEAFSSPTPGAGEVDGDNIINIDDVLPLDINNCPNEPPVGYPYGWHILDILHHWPADDPEPRLELFQGICVFDFVKDHEKALAYRDAEVPFVVKGDPAVAKVSPMVISDDTDQ